MIAFPRAVDPNTGYAVNAFDGRVIHKMIQARGTHVQASSDGFEEMGKKIHPNKGNKSPSTDDHK